MSANDVYTKLRTAPDYHPSSVDLFDDCTLQAGDVVTVRSGSDSYSLPIFSQHLVWNGASTVQLESTGNEKRSDLPALRKKSLNTSYGLGSGAYGTQKGNEEKFKKYETHFEQTDQYFSLLATESEWDELAQEGHVTAYTQILQTARDISMVAAKTGIDGLAEDETLFSRITMNAESIISEVKRAKGEEASLSSKITQTAESITAEVERAKNAEKGLEGSISTVKQTADAVSLEVANARGDAATLSAHLTVMKDKIESEVTDRTNADSALSSKITQTAESITTKVSKGEIASTINQTAQGVLIQASKIDLEGYVTVSDLEATNAKITNLTSGYSEASVIKTIALHVSNGFTFRGKTVDSNPVTVGQKTFRVLSTDGNMPGSIVYSDLPHYHAITATPDSSGKVTLTLGAAQGTEGTANFNIADTQFYKDGVSAAYENAKPTEVSRVATYDADANAYKVSVVVKSADGTKKTFDLADIDAKAAYDAGAATVTLEGGAASTSNIVWDTTIRKIGSVTGTVTVKLSNGNSYSRTVSDIKAPSVYHVDVNTATDKCTVHYKNVSSGYTSTDVFDW